MLGIFIEKHQVYEGAAEMGVLRHWGSILERQWG